MNGGACVANDEQEFAFWEELLQVRAVLEDGEVFVAKADGGFIEASKNFLWKIKKMSHFLEDIKRGFNGYCKYFARIMRSTIQSTL